MIIRDIPEYIRRQAFREAEERDVLDRAQGWRPRMDDEKVGFNTLEANWQGNLGELMLHREYPFLYRTPHAERERGPPKPDFLCDGEPWECKTQRQYPIRPEYLVNVEQHGRMLSITDWLVLTVIDGPPAKAYRWAALGWMPHEDAGRFPIDKTRASPAYTVPRDVLDGDLDALIRVCRKKSF